MHKIGYYLEQQGRLKEAEVFYRRDLEGSERNLGRDHNNTLTAVNSVGLLLQAQGKLLSLAEDFFRRSLEGCERTRGCDHPSTLTAVNNMGGLLQTQGKFDLAEPFLRRSLA